jgi:hypothetical protein
MRSAARPTLRLAAALGLALAIVAAQALGFAHRVLHAPGHAVAHGHHHAHGHDAGSCDDAHRAAPTGFAGAAGLFDDHDESECRLYDQTAQGEGLAAAATPPLDAAGPAKPAEHHGAWLLAHQAAGALARGPPPIG